MTTTDSPRSESLAAATGPTVPAADIVWRALLGLYTLGLLAMFFLAGEGIWRAGSGNTGAATLDPHRSLGYVMDLVALLMLVAALVARRSRAVVVLSAVVLAVNLLQGVWVNLAESARVLGGLHTVGAMVLVAVVIPLHRLSRR